MRPKAIVDGERVRHAGNAERRRERALSAHGRSRTDVIVEADVMRGRGRGIEEKRERSLFVQGECGRRERPRLSFGSPRLPGQMMRRFGEARDRRVIPRWRGSIS